MKDIAHHLTYVLAAAQARVRLNGTSVVYAAGLGAWQ